MMTILFTLLVFLIAMGGLALGVIAGRPPLKGSCGGLACLGKTDCAACGARRERH